MELETKYYGTVSYQADELIRFPAGLPGFEKNTNFLVLQSDDSIFGCLQSVDDPNLAFVLISPYLVCSDYSIHLPTEDVQVLQLTGPEEAELLAVVSVRSNIEESSVNLQAPLVINKNKRLGRQALLPETGYPIRHMLWNKEAVAQYRCSG